MKIIGHGRIESSGGPDDEYTHWVYYNNNKGNKEYSLAESTWFVGSGYDCSTDIHKLRLCFKLKDELPIISGTGEQGTPYQLVEVE